MTASIPGLARGLARLRRREALRAWPESLLVLARRDPRALAGFDVRIQLTDHRPPPAWATWLAHVQQVSRGEPQLRFRVGVEAAPGSYIVEFDPRREPPGYRGIWRVLDDAPVSAAAEGAILLVMRAQVIDGRRLGSNQVWRRAAAAALASDAGQGSWALQTFVERFLAPRQSASPAGRDG